MTTARKMIVDPNRTRCYHCISTCVRSERLLACDKSGKRKKWIEDRLKSLAEQFAVSVCGFAILDNHMHVLCRLDPSTATDWSDEEVVRRWLAIYPPKTMDIDNPASVAAFVKNDLKSKKKVKKYRSRLANLGWFMKALKEPLARMANKEDGVRGPFWKPRFKSIAVLDEGALLATQTYIDLNIVAAGMAETPESSEYTSIKQRVEHARSKGKLKALQSALLGSVAGCEALGPIEQDHWLVPVEDYRSRDKNSREGMLESFSLGSYLALIDYVSRLRREGKARVSSELHDIFTRLETNAEAWGHQLDRMLASAGNLRGNFFATGSNKLRELRETRKRRVQNLSPQVIA